MLDGYLRQLPGHYQHIPLTKVEDLQDAVYGAGLEATQLSHGTIGGSLVFSHSGDITTTSGLIEGKVTLTGPLSLNQLSLGIGLRMMPGTRHWYRETATGAVGIFLPGDMHEALYFPGSMYVVVTLSLEYMEARAAQLDLVLDRKTLGGTRIHSHRIVSPQLASIFQRIRRMHVQPSADDGIGTTIGADVLDTMIRHCARLPFAFSMRCPNGHSHIVKRARDYLEAHLQEPISIDAVAAAANTSRRTLFRAFHDVLGESPQSYTRALRLHRIRCDLAAPAEALCTISLIANKWGVSELGRLSGWYHDLFGELPSETRKQFSGFKNSALQSL